LGDGHKTCYFRFKLAVMRLEDEIKQPRFKSNKQKAVINLMYSSGYLINFLGEKAKAFDITRQQYNVLRILKGQLPKSASINLIKERMLDKMSDASRIVERLRVKELVERATSASDKRAVDITITPKGIKLLEDMEPAVNSVDNLFEKFTEQELNTFNALLDKMRD
jgi:DNA-binding MarR family transcriptional regulator